MATCGNTPPARGMAKAACSGKCLNQTCASAPRVWVLAACGGMISLFEKHLDGTLTLLRHGEGAVAPSIDYARGYMVDNLKAGLWNQLVLVGSKNDMSWAQALLPEPVMGHILAEIEYPIPAGWFREYDMTSLGHALANLFRH